MSAPMKAPRTPEAVLMTEVLESALAFVEDYEDEDDRAMLDDRAHGLAAMLREAIEGLRE